MKYLIYAIDALLLYTIYAKRGTKYIENFLTVFAGIVLILYTSIKAFQHYIMHDEPLLSNIYLNNTITDFEEFSLLIFNIYIFIYFLIPKIRKR